MRAAAPAEDGRPLALGGCEVENAFIQGDGYLPQPSGPARSRAPFNNRRGEFFGTWK